MRDHLRSILRQLRLSGLAQSLEVRLVWPQSVEDRGVVHGLEARLVFELLDEVAVPMQSRGKAHETVHPLRGLCVATCRVLLAQFPRATASRLIRLTDGHRADGQCDRDAAARFRCLVGIRPCPSIVPAARREKRV